MNASAEAVTTRGSVERRLLIANTSTHGQLWHVTGGEHLTSDDFIIARALKERAALVKEKEAEKKRSKEAEKRRDDAMKLIEKLQGGESEISVYDHSEKLRVGELEILLKWKLSRNSVPSDVKRSKATRLAKWQQLKSATVPMDEWTEENEKELVELKRNDIGIENTSLAKLKKRQSNEAFAAIAAASPETKKRFREALAAQEGEEEVGNVEVTEI